MKRIFFLTTAGLLLVTSSLVADTTDAVRKIGVGELVSAFMKNEAFADEQFVGRSLEITGRLLVVRRSDHSAGPGPGMPTVYVVEMIEGDSNNLRTTCVVLFFFDELSRKQLAGVKNGQYITIMGECGRRVLIPAAPPPLGEFHANRPPKSFSEIRVKNCKLVSVEEPLPDQDRGANGQP